MENEVELMKELMKRNDEELQELKEKLTQRDKVISFLLCDTRQSIFTDKQERSDSAGSGNTEGNVHNKFGLPMKEIRNLGEIIDKIEEINVHQKNSNRKIEEMTQDIFNNVKSLKIKLDDETKKTDEINKTVLNNKINIEVLNFKIGHIDQEMKELKNVLIAKNKLLTQPNADVDSGKNGMSQLFEKVDNIEKNVTKLIAMFENAGMIVSALGGTKKKIIEQSKEMKNTDKISQGLGSVNQEVSVLDDGKKEACELKKEVENTNRILQEVNNNYECLFQRVQENKIEIENLRGLQEQEKKKFKKHIKQIADNDKVLYESEEEVKQRLCEIEALKRDVAILKEHKNAQDRKICGLDSEIGNALSTGNWEECVKIIKIATPEHDTVYKQLQKVKSDENLPLAAAEKGYAELIQVLLCNGLNVNEKMVCNKQTMLHSAAGHGNNNVVELLLSNDADIDVRDNKGYAPLHYAAYGGHASTVQLLIEKGADINTRENMGNTPLHWTAANGHVSTVQLLIEKGADIDIGENGGWTPLNCAAYNGHVSTVQLLIEKGANINSSQNQGFTPLHSAARNGHVSTLQLLIEKGAEINPRKIANRTPLHIAALYGHISVVQCLLDNNCDRESIDKYGKTALDYARENGYSNIVRLLE